MCVLDQLVFRVIHFVRQIFCLFFFLEREVRNSVVNKVERLLCAFFIRFPVLDKNLVEKQGYFIFEINLH